MAVIFVLSSLDAARWVMDQGRMAFRGNRGNRLRAGERFGLYTTTRATGRGGQLVAVGTITGELVVEGLRVAGDTFESSITLEFEKTLPVGEGAPFSELVPRLGFIRNKRRWSIHFFRTVVHVPREDFAELETWFSLAVEAHADPASRPPPEPT